MSTQRRTVVSYNRYAGSWASLMRSGGNTSHRYLEKPAMFRALPSLRGKTVLCVGCGTGEECELLMKLGAKRVVGTDISKNLIREAKRAFPAIEFYTRDMERLRLPAHAFDVVYSSLTMHYVPSWKQTLAQVKKVLKPGGQFVFSTHHPVRWGAETKETKHHKSHILGYEKIDKGKAIVYGDYLNGHWIHDRWFGDFDVTYYHRPLSLLIRDILESGLELIDFQEPKPLATVRRENPQYWKIHQKIPLFMIFVLRKKESK